MKRPGVFREHRNAVVALAIWLPIGLAAWAGLIWLAVRLVRAVMG